MMKKVDLPKLLISYSTLDDYEAKRAPELSSALLRAVLRPRTLIYCLIWAGLGLGLITSLLLRDRLDVSVEHDRNPKFVRLSDGSVRNAFTFQIANMRPEARVFEIVLDGLPDAVLSDANGGEGATLRVNAPADKTHEARLFVTMPGGAENQSDFDFVVRDLFGTDEARYDASFFAP